MSSSGSTETQSVSFSKSEKQTYMVLDHDGNHEYDLVVIDHGNTFAVRTIELYHSNGEQWTSEVRGQLALSVTDNGNGVKFDRKLKKLDYSELLYLRIILNFEHKTTSNELDREDYTIVSPCNEIHV